MQRFYLGRHLAKIICKGLSEGCFGRREDILENTLLRFRILQPCLRNVLAIIIAQSRRRCFRRQYGTLSELLFNLKLIFVNKWDELYFTLI
jgi:hypothetical protein